MNDTIENFFVTGGTLRHDAPSYVERQADKDLYDGLTKGKFWRQTERFGPAQRLFTAIREVALSKQSGALVIFVDELDTVRSLPFSTDEFFAAIRECYNRRTQDPEFNRLTFCLLGVATPSDLIRDIRMTPFNIGRRIELHDFTAAEAAILAKGFCTDAKTADTLLHRILHWTHGHPYLTQRLGLAVAEANASEISPRSAIRDPQSIDRLCEELFLSVRARERDDNLLFVRERMLRSDGDLGGLMTLYGHSSEILMIAATVVGGLTSSFGPLRPVRMIFDVLNVASEGAEERIQTNVHISRALLSFPSLEAPPQFSSV